MLCLQSPQGSFDGRERQLLALSIATCSSKDSFKGGVYDGCCACSHLGAALMSENDSCSLWARKGDPGCSRSLRAEGGAPGGLADALAPPESVVWHAPAGCDFSVEVRCVSRSAKPLEQRGLGWVLRFGVGVWATGPWIQHS